MPSTTATPLSLESPAFRPGDPLPERCVQNGGKAASPPLSWSGAPEGTQSWVLVLERLDRRAPSVHWLVYDLPGAARSLPEGLPESERLDGGGLHGRNDFGNLGYDGPRSDEADGDLRLVLYALDKRLSGVGARMTWHEIRRLLDGHVLDRAELQVRAR